MSQKKNIFNFKVKKIDGTEVSLSEYKGKVLLIVNTASKCGFTPQFKELESLYKEYNEKEFEILGFPSNDFSEQEPLEGYDIQSFCEINYGVTFPIFDKTKVKGKNQSELFKFLSDKKQNGSINSTPRWNFHKYLIDKNGEVRDYFYTFTKPTANRVKTKIDQLLKE
ncbi:MAG: glutathione peroxidase [Chitinophagaceae bacterium]|nr:MAG: glutathione peroxidase [Chitinophagaceae bacterium]